MKHSNRTNKQTINASNIDKHIDSNECCLTSRHADKQTSRLADKKADCKEGMTVGKITALRLTCR